MQNFPLTIHTDGGSRGNPGPAATGIVIMDTTGTVIHEFGRFLGVATNNVAEYSAVLHALEYLLSEPVILDPERSRRDPGSISIYFKLDSQLVVEQLSGRWKIKDQNLFKLATQIHQLTASLPSHLTVSYAYVPRAQNAAADRQVNLCLDQNV